MREKPSPTCSCSEHPFQPGGVVRRQLQIGAGESRPLLRTARIGLKQMGDGEARPQRRTVAPIEGEKLGGQTILQCVNGASPDRFTRVPAAQALAFDTKERDLVERIDGSKPRIELQTVDDPDGVAKPDMFRPQIAASVDNVTTAHAIDDQPRSLAEKPALSLIDLPDGPGRKAKPRVQQNPPIVGEAVLPVRKMSLG